MCDNALLKSLCVIFMVLTFVGTFICGFAPFITMKVIDSSIRSKLVIQDDSMTDAKFKAPDAITYKVTMFNLTNLKDVLSGVAKPNYAEVGPYVFKKYPIKVDLKMANDKNSYSYLSRNYLVAEKTSGLDFEKDKFVTVDPIFLGVIAGTGFTYAPSDNSAVTGPVQGEATFYAASTASLINSYFNSESSPLTGAMVPFYWSVLSSTMNRCYNFSEVQAIAQFVGGYNNPITSSTNANNLPDCPAAYALFSNFSLPDSTLFTVPCAIATLFNSASAASVFPGVSDNWADLANNDCSGVKKIAAQTKIATAIATSCSISNQATVGAMVSLVANWLKSRPTLPTYLVAVGALLQKVGFTAPEVSSWKSIWQIQFGTSRVSQALLNRTMMSTTAPVEWKNEVTSGSTLAPAEVDAFLTFVSQKVALFAATTPTWSDSTWAMFSLPKGSEYRMWIDNGLVKKFSASVPSTLSCGNNDDGTAKETGLFTQRTVKDMLFGYVNLPLTAKAGRVVAFPGIEYLGDVADESVWTKSYINAYGIAARDVRDTGRIEVNNVQHILKYSGDEVISTVSSSAQLANTGRRFDGKVWDSPEVIKGSMDGAAGFPVMDTSDSFTKSGAVYVGQVSRCLQFEYEAGIAFKGIDLRKFALNPLALQNTTGNPLNSKYFMSQIPHGLAPIASKMSGLELVMSFPHFLMADPAIRNTMTGMNPQPSLHSSFLGVDPFTGKTLQAAKRLQINWRLGDKYNINFQTKAVLPVASSYNKFIEKGSTVYVPAMWIEESGGLSDEDADKYKSTIYGAINAANHAQWIGTPILAVAFAGLCFWFYILFIQSSPGSSAFSSDVTGVSMAARDGVAVF